MEQSPPMPSLDAGCTAFTWSKRVRASLLWVKGVTLNPCALNTALLSSALLGSPLSLEQCLAHSVTPSWWLLRPLPAMVTPVPVSVLETGCAF